MIATLTAIASALIALISGLVGGYLTGKRQSALEYQKWWRSRADDLAKEARVAVAELTKNLGAATHAMAWLTWDAKNRPNHLTIKDVQNYDDEMHKLFPIISGSLALVSALSVELYQKMEPLVEQVYTLDEQIALAATQLADEQTEGAVLLGRYHEEVSTYTEGLNRRVADILQRKENVPVSADLGNMVSPSPSAAPDGNPALRGRRR